MPCSLPQFLPYLLNQAAEASSTGFQRHYRRKYGMLRTEWRVLFHLGLYDAMTATQICRSASLHKTKVSRAVAALERKRFVQRQTDAGDRRAEMLSLTTRGRQVFEDLHQEAARYEATLTAALSADEVAQLRSLLLRLMDERPKS